MKPSNLKRLRLSLDLTPGYCANGMHVSRQTIYNIEDGKVPMSTMYFYELYLKDVKRRREYARQRREQSGELYGLAVDIDK